MKIIGIICGRTFNHYEKFELELLNIIYATIGKSSTKDLNKYITLIAGAPSRVSNIKILIEKFSKSHNIPFTILEFRPNSPISIRINLSPPKPRRILKNLLPVCNSEISNVESSKKYVSNESPTLLVKGFPHLEGKNKSSNPIRKSPPHLRVEKLKIIKTPTLSEQKGSRYDYKESEKNPMNYSKVDNRTQTHSLATKARKSNSLPLSPRIDEIKEIKELSKDDASIHTNQKTIKILESTKKNDVIIRDLHTNEISYASNITQEKELLKKVNILDIIDECNILIVFLDSTSRGILFSIVQKAQQKNIPFFIFGPENY